MGCERGANVNAAMTTDGFTGLMGASQNGHLGVARELCEWGANVNAARSTDGLTILMFASKNGHLAVVKYLLEHGANKAALNFSGHDAYYYAGKKVVADIRGLLQ